MTVVNSIGFGLAAAFFITALLSTDWLEGRYAIRTRVLRKDLTSDLYKVIDINSTVRVVTQLRYSLEHLCVRVVYDDVVLSERYENLLTNVTLRYERIGRNICYEYGHIRSKLPIYAIEDIKRFTHVYVYIWCTVGMVSLGTFLSLMDIFVPRSKLKTILKFTAIGVCFLAGICGMIGMLLARIKRTRDSHLTWNYGYSFVLGCVAESLLVTMLLYNGLKFYLRTRKQVSEECYHLKQEEYPLTAAM